MAEDFIHVELDHKDLMKELSAFDKQMPNVAKKLMRAVNNEVKKQIRRTARSRGYLPNKETEYGNAGYSKNLKSYADNGYKAKIMMGRNAFQYRFIEYGANVKPKNGKYLTFKINGQYYKSQGFTLPVNPLIYPIANSIWGTSRASEIMEKKMQEIMDKQFKK